MVIENDSDHAKALIRLRELMEQSDDIGFFYGDEFSTAEDAEIDALAKEILHWENLKFPRHD